LLILEGLREDQALHLLLLLLLLLLHHLLLLLLTNLT
jgi:hypothetical protein